MTTKTFNKYSDFKHQLLAILTQHISTSAPTPHAVVLPGGSTPFGIYETLATDPPRIDKEFHAILSDERHLPRSSTESNFGRMQPLFAAMGLEDRQVIHPDTSLDLDDCAEEYDRKLEEFFERCGEITLGILGLGADGHTASLFNSADLENRKNPFAVPVHRPTPPNRISITKNLISRIKKIVFICVGPEKQEIVGRMNNPNAETIAAKAVKEVEEVELWYSPQRGQ